MTAGYPDWTSGILATPPNVLSHQFTGSVVADTVTVVVTPPANQRVRLLGYRVNMAFNVALGATAGLSTYTVSIQSSAASIKERMALYLGALANAVANGSVDSGLVVIPGGGIALPVNQTLDRRDIRTTQAGGTINFAVHITLYYVTELP